MPATQLLDDVGPHRVVEHGRRAHLHRAAAEQEVVEGLARSRRCRRCPEKLFSGNARVICAILASDCGRMAGPPRPPLDTRPSTFISNSSVSGSMTGSEGNVFEETTASPPPRKTAPASITMSVVEGVSFAHTGTLATSFTTWVTIEQSFWSLPMLEPMSSRSMCGQDRFSSRPSAPCSWQARARVRQWSSSLSLPEPAMIDAMSTRSGNAFLMRPRRGTHQSSGLSEISSQFHDECSAPVAALVHGERARLGVAAQELGLGPRHVHHRVQADGLGDHAAPARLEGAQDVALGFGGRRRREQEGVPETDPREGHRQIDAHGGLLELRLRRREDSAVSPGPHPGPAPG